MLYPPRFAPTVGPVKFLALITHFRASCKLSLSQAVSNTSNSEELFTLSLQL